MERLSVQVCLLNNSKSTQSQKRAVQFRSSRYMNRISSYTLSKTHEVYLRLAPVVTDTFVCRSRPVVLSTIEEEVRPAKISITLMAPS